MSKLIVVSAPSGGGKTSLIKALLKDFDEVDILLGVSFTTRKARSKEKNGQSYYFISKKEFQKKIVLVSKKYPDCFQSASDIISLTQRGMLYSDRIIPELIF